MVKSVGVGIFIVGTFTYKIHNLEDTTTFYKYVFTFTCLYIVPKKPIEIDHKCSKAQNEGPTSIWTINCIWLSDRPKKLDKNKALFHQNTCDNIHTLLLLFANWFLNVF